jgi:RNA 3'-terminal phosphate cyclase (ATP)
VLDGSQGEGGGQILRSALTLSLLTNRPFTIKKIRAHRDKPGLRPQHLAGVRAASLLGNAVVHGADVGSRELTYSPTPFTATDLDIDIGTAGATGLILQTLHFPLALRGDKAVRLTLSGGTFNLRAPSYPFLDSTWRAYMAAMGLPVALSMPRAGFYPRGGGKLDAWIEPGQPKPLELIERGRLLRVRGTAGTANLTRNAVAERMRKRALERLAPLGVPVEIELADWPAPSPGAAISLIAEHAANMSAFVGLGAPGKPAETVADEAVQELLEYEDSMGAVDTHSADQLLLPLAFASGPSNFTVAEISEHLRTNVATISSFIERSIRIQEPTAGEPGRVCVD